MSDLTERIERLIAQDASAMLREHRLALVQKIVATLRQATPAMIDAGENELRGAADEGNPPSASKVWGAMVDAALS